MHVPKVPNCDICLLKDENNKGFLQKTCWCCRAQSGKCWWFWQLQITKFSVKEVNRVTIIDTPWWYKIWQHSGYNHTRVKQKLTRRPRRAQWSSWSRRGNQKSFTLTVASKFGKSCEDLSWNHCTSTPPRSETNGIAERAVRRVQEGTCAVLLQSGLDEKWRADSMDALPICETFKISCLMGRHHKKGGSECPLTDHWYRLEQWSNIALSLRRTYRDSISSVQKSCQVYSSVMYCMRVESGKVTLWSQTLKNWRRWTHQNSTPEGSM